MKKFTKQQSKDVSDAQDACQIASEELQTAIDAYNEAVGPQRDAVKAALDTYNEKVADLKGVYEDIAGEARDYYDNRSEKWQEGDTGQAYQEWLDSLESPDLDDAEIEIPEDLEFPESIPDFSSPEFLPADEPGGA